MSSTIGLVLAATLPGNPAVANEDWVCANSSLIVVLDGATARTGTGCRHGIAWYTQQLGAALVAGVQDVDQELTAVLAAAIESVTARHPGCDLTHPGTPSAAVGIVRTAGGRTRYLVLGDITLVLDRGGVLDVVVDERVSQTAADARELADQHPIGSAGKAAALLAMKQGELAARNRPGGYWIAATDPAAAAHALVGEYPAAEVDRLAVLTDGAARAVSFGLLDWTGILAVLATRGPAELLARVRQAESEDPTGAMWPRNKQSDDATAVYTDR